jgi:hypothetical protein
MQLFLTQPAKKVDKRGKVPGNWKLGKGSGCGQTDKIY